MVETQSLLVYKVAIIIGNDFSKRKIRKNKLATKSGIVRRFKSGERGAIRMARKAAQRVFNLNIESNIGVAKCPDGLELGHNAVVLHDSALLNTFQGIQDQESATGKRIGDKVTLQRVVIKGMLELNERYSDVSVKIVVIKSAKSDTPTQATLWQGASGNKMLDTFNTERFTILKSKSKKLKAPNMAIVSAGGTSQTTGSGWTLGTTATQQSCANRIFTISMPGKRFVRNGIVQYRNGSPQPKFFDYHLAFFAYSNFST